MASTAPGEASPPRWVTRRSSSGSRTSASSTAPACSWRSGRSTDLIKMMADQTPTARTATETMQAKMADAMAPSRIELTLEWNEVLRRASAARMTPTVAKTAAIAGTIASRARRVRTSQLLRAP